MRVKINIRKKRTAAESGGARLSVPGICGIIAVSKSESVKRVGYSEAWLLPVSILFRISRFVYSAYLQGVMH